MTAAVQEPASLEGLLGSVGETMTGAVVLLAADMPAEWALRHLDRQAVSGAPVVDHGRVVGVVTRRDLLVPIPEQGSYANPLDGVTVGDLMSGDPVTARPDWPLVRAVRAMVDHGVNRVPVVDDAGRPHGILTRDDVLRTLAARDRGGQERAAGRGATGQRRRR
jgi:predicted transcriptional regulator